jgi:hypothetical protein
VVVWSVLSFAVTYLYLQNDEYGDKCDMQNHKEHILKTFLLYLSTPFQIWGFHDGEYYDNGILECDAGYFGR